MKKIIAAVIAASALLGVSQAFAYEQTTVTTTRSYHSEQHNDWRRQQEMRHEAWVREHQHREYVAHHPYHRDY